MTSTQPNPIQTTDAGIPVQSDKYSLTVGAGGPILLQDSYLIEQMANFNRERIKERQPHAKGSGAFGRFEVTGDVSAYTRAAFLQPGTETRMVARFSTVAGERGSPDMWRDLRGYALKFYTTEGNYDMVGNDTPVFFIKDPIHFQNFIRSQKRLAKVNLRSNDMQWDFWTLLPQTAHQVIWLMGDRDDYRECRGVLPVRPGRSPRETCRAVCGAGRRAGPIARAAIHRRGGRPVHLQPAGGLRGRRWGHRTGHPGGGGPGRGAWPDPGG